MTTDYQLLLVDDHALFREGLESILAVRLPEARLHCCASASAADAMLREASIDLVLLDIELGPDNGLDWLQRWRARHPGLAIAILSASIEAPNVERALALGARGFIPKTSTGALLAGALGVIRAGGIYVPPELLPGRAPLPEGDLASDAAGAGDPPGLTPRQQQVLVLLAEGQSNKAIARLLDMADGTVRTHINAIFKALEVSNRTQAVRRAQERGWL